MTREQIVIRVSANGQIDAETKGMTGPKCLDTISLLEDLLEAATTSSAFTADYAHTPLMTEAGADDELLH